MKMTKKEFVVDDINSNLSIDYVKNLCLDIDDDIIDITLKDNTKTINFTFLKNKNLLLSFNRKKYNKYYIFGVFIDYSYLHGRANYYILLDENYNIILDDIKSYVIHNNNLCVVYSDEIILQIYDSDFNKLISTKMFVNEISFKPHLNYIKVLNTEKLFGAVDFNGNLILDFEYDLILNTSSENDSSKTYLMCYKKLQTVLVDDLIENYKLQHNLKMINDSL